jgi:hypothetical protein
MIMIVDVTHVEVLDPYRLHLRFDDGTEGDVDIAAHVSFDGVFAPLRDPNMFRQVWVEPEFGTIVWSCGADIDPFVLHEWAAGRRIQESEEVATSDPAIPATAAASSRVRKDPLPAEDLGSQEISRFLGMVVRMPYRDHGAPHVRVTYDGHEATFALGPVRLLGGTLPPRAIGFVMEWAALHERELIEDWELAAGRAPLKRIAPLE